MLRILYTVYFWLIAMPVFFVCTALTAWIVIGGCMLGGERFFAFYPGMIWAKITCYLALCPVKVRGKEHLPKKQACLFVSNHQGAFDIFLIYGFLGIPIRWMMKIGLKKLPFVGAACRAAGFIFVDHASLRAVRNSIEEAERQLQNGESLVIFPEGARTEDGKMSRFQKGAFQVSVNTQRPIVPITLNGPYKVLPVGSICVRPHRMEMVIHPPIRTDEPIYSGKDGLLRLADRTREIIASALWEEFK